MQTILTDTQTATATKATATCQFDHGTCNSPVHGTIWLRGIGSDGAWPVEMCEAHFKRVRRMLGSVGMTSEDLGLSPLA